MKMKNAGLKNLLEKSVTVSIVFAWVLTAFSILVQIFFSEKYYFFDAIYKSPYFAILALLICLLLILWITIGEGLSGKLWDWLPPFLFFKEFGRFGRCAIVLVLVVAMLSGIFSDLKDILWNK